MTGLGLDLPNQCSDAVNPVSWFELNVADIGARPKAFYSGLSSRSRG